MSLPDITGEAEVRDITEIAQSFMGILHTSHAINFSVIYVQLICWFEPD